MFNKRNKLEKWMDKQLKLMPQNLDHGELVTLKYGIRTLLALGTTPITECEFGSEQKINGENPHYWLVNNTQNIKVRLFPWLSIIGDDRITGIGKDGKYFKYTLVKL